MVDLRNSVIEFAVAAKQYDLRAQSEAARARLFKPFEPHVERTAYSKKHLGCGRAGTILRLGSGGVALIDGPPMTELATATVASDDQAYAVTTTLLSAKDGGCSDTCIVASRDVRFRRLKQVMRAASERCGTDVLVALAPP